VFKAEEVRDFTRKRNLAERFAERFGANVAESMAAALTRVTLR
jgi:protease-4